jgi:hypothetical protein
MGPAVLHLWLSVGSLDLINDNCLDAGSLKHPACNRNGSSHYRQDATPEVS